MGLLASLGWVKAQVSWLGIFGQAYLCSDHNFNYPPNLCRPYGLNDVLVR